MSMTDIKSLIPPDKPKPTFRGQRFRAWIDLDRKSLMQLRRFLWKLGLLEKQGPDGIAT
jgi:hypothetical protein